MRIALAVVMLCMVAPCSGQEGGDLGSDERLVLETVEKLFQGMKAGDSARVRSVFSAEAQLYTSYQGKDGEPVLKKAICKSSWMQWVHPMRWCGMSPYGRLK